MGIINICGDFFCVCVLRSKEQTLLYQNLLHPGMESEGVKASETEVLKELETCWF